ncbi:pentatricopeptide repeat-containing protein At4g39530-like [Mangifera indica]|uniref:pentatricopeptide repeat-containing protein At4g39530-like n=1 Tax=Mangifera indica TaxID=29780 RepID=UPI001CFB52EA|nr:pentatricopeptide repeat-containing protein At4g39530-like [Mangifera indica]XP_044470237.1 pentatricopeptide repeat-containing protein At4g39530-like [Mangifera indica]XP_044470238.1 pentatricopeptide repeat-containing protein At4g39530-like [Mangifera indica]XP_044470239.1 pentatricopeptide repeat-containing protein At4g39530-like [Mangifera indica]
MRHLTQHLKQRCNAITFKQSFSFSNLAEQNQPSLLYLRKRRDLAHLLQLPLTENCNRNLCCEQVHAQVFVNGLHSDTFLGNLMLHNYSKRKKLSYVCNLFDKMCERNLVSWSSMVSMYTQSGYHEKALMVFIGFLKNFDGRPNEYILASVVRACTQLGGGRDLGEQIHGFVIKSGFDQDVYVGTSLVDFYAKSGCIDDAKMVFDGLVVKSSVSWTTIISGYVKSGGSDVSLKLFSEMRQTDVVPDKYVLSSVISACSMLEFVSGGKQIHAYVLRRGTEMDVSVVNVLIDFYTKCGRVKIARRLFDEMVVKNVISWTTMIAGYMQNSFDMEAMKLFSEMTRSGWKPDNFACTSVLTSCGSLVALEQGRQVHAYSIKTNLEFDNFVKNGLIDMYAKCDSLSDARGVFNLMDDHNVVSYNAMIEGYSKQEKLSEALDLFHEMRLSVVPPSLLTFVSILGLSAALSTLALSRQIHGLIIKYGVSFDLFTGSSLIDVYSKCSCIKEARMIFEEMNEKDIVVWNAMLFGYTQQSENEEALKLYLELQLSRQRRNEFTFAALITAASNLASLQHGQQFHSHLIKLGLEFDPFVTNALIDMYAKCGSFAEAHKTFSSTIWKDVACWNSMISTYAHHGEAKEALLLFEEMMKYGLKPNYVTFVGVLSACSHAGLVDEGLCHFESMAGFGIVPGTEHYACVVSLLGRAGKLNQAVEFIEKMPIEPAAAVWRSLLSACRTSGNVELGKYAAGMAISIDPTDSGSYTLLSNIFADKGMWADAKRVRERMDSDGVMKEPGRSWIGLNNEVHAFIARDKTHCEADQMYSVLDNLILQIKGIGYVPDTTTLLLND